TVARQNPCQLPGLCASDHRHVAADHCDVPEVGLRGEIAGKFAQGDIHGTVYFAGPGERWPRAGDDGYLLIPEMQDQNTAPRSNKRTILEQQRILGPHDLESKEALRVECVLIHSNLAADTTVERKDCRLQPAPRASVFRCAVGALRNESHHAPIIASHIATREI